MPRLILLGGPTGVGKSTALPLIGASLPASAVLDADDVWRVAADLAVSENRGIAIGNTISVMRGYFEAGCEIGVLAWVFARPQLFQPVMTQLEDIATPERLYLVAEPECLAQRLNARGHAERLEYALSRLRLIQDLPCPKIDTTHLSPAQVAASVCEEIQRES